MVCRVRDTVCEQSEALRAVVRSHNAGRLEDARVRGVCVVQRGGKNKTAGGMQGGGQGRRNGRDLLFGGRWVNTGAVWCAHWAW